MRNKSGSVAPKERINIVYKPVGGGQHDASELPFRMLVTGDFSKSEDGTPVEERELINVNGKNFNSVMQKVGAKVNFQAENTLSGKDDEVVNVDLKFKSIRDFNPDSIAQQVPEIKELLDMRDSLVALKGPIGNLPNLRKVIQNKLQEQEEGSLSDTLKLEQKDDGEQV